MNLPEDWLSVADISEYMNMSTFEVLSQLRSGALPGVRFGREWRIARSDFDEWLNEQRAAADSPVHESGPNREFE